ncbi:MAG: EAL domain-containing protein [Thermoanaerobacteraceae bacterium]|nr:EAL domain-containing protein [Thermoanaerobacteraceae bacterium]
MVRKMSKSAALRKALAGDVQTFLQPVINIRANRIEGFEALTRGPAGTVLEKSNRLFSYAGNKGKIRPLEHRCIKNGLSVAKYLNGKKLFINVGSSIFEDKLDGIADSFIRKNGDCKIVLELTEHFKTNVESLVEAASWYRSRNISIAVDDVSSGHDRLKSILYLKPEYFKLERELIAGCDKDENRRSIINHLLQIGQSLGSQVIAEGVETRAELNTLMEIGLELCQGFLFSKPFPAFKLMNGQFKDISCWR